jgi:hypothetical protein
MMEKALISCSGSCVRRGGVTSNPQIQKKVGHCNPSINKFPFASVDIKKYKYESTLTFLIIMVSFDPSKYVNQ